MRLVVPCSGPRSGNPVGLRVRSAEWGKFVTCQPRPGLRLAPIRWCGSFWRRDAPQSVPFWHTCPLPQGRMGPVSRTGYPQARGWLPGATRWLTGGLAEATLWEGSLDPQVCHFGTPLPSVDRLAWKLRTRAAARLRAQSALSYGGGRCNMTSVSRRRRMRTQTGTGFTRGAR